MTNFLNPNSLNPSTCVPVLSLSSTRLPNRWPHGIFLNQNPLWKTPLFMSHDPDGTEYFYCGGTRIKISERFASQGKEMEHLVEDAIQFAARLA